MQQQREVKMTSQIIRSIWSQELNIADFSDDDDFFSLGGHSLIMTKIQVSIKEKIGVEVPMDDLFRHSTVKKLSAYLEHAYSTV